MGISSERARTWALIIHVVEHESKAPTLSYRICFFQFSLLAIHPGAMRHKDALLSIGGPTCSAAGPVKAHQVPCSAVRLKLGASNCPQPRCAPLKKTSVLAAKSCPSQNSLKFLATVVQHHRTARICQR